jgi:hypothetical protein
MSSDYPTHADVATVLRAARNWADAEDRLRATATGDWDARIEAQRQKNIASQLLYDAVHGRHRPYRAHEGEWGLLDGEPCRYCHQIGKVLYLVDDGPEGKSGLQVVRCDACKRSWVVDSALA